MSDEKQIEEQKPLSPHAQLTQKLIQAATKYGTISEQGKNDHSDYKYITTHQVDNKFRLAQDEFKFMVFPSINHKECQRQDMGTTANGKTIIRSKVVMDFEVVDAETGFVKNFTWVGEDQDAGGKDFAQAITECCKRFKMKLLGVSSRKDDPDSNTVEIIGHHGRWEKRAAKTIKDAGSKYDQKQRIEIRTKFWVMCKEHKGDETIAGLFVDAQTFGPVETWDDEFLDQIVTTLTEKGVELENVKKTATD